MAKENLSAKEMSRTAKWLDKHRVNPDKTKQWPTEKELDSTADLTVAAARWLGELHGVNAGWILGMIHGEQRRRMNRQDRAIYDAALRLEGKRKKAA